MIPLCSLGTLYFGIKAKFRQWAIGKRKTIILCYCELHENLLLGFMVCCVVFVIGVVGVRLRIMY